jgi:hypothetical protein
MSVLELDLSNLNNVRRVLENDWEWIAWGVVAIYFAPDVAASVISLAVDAIALLYALLAPAGA